MREFRAEMELSKRRVSHLIISVIFDIPRNWIFKTYHAS